MISQTVEYALRAVVYLAMHPGSHTTDEISIHTKVPGSYLCKVLQKLAKSGMVISQRGLRGGFILAKTADQITALDVVNVVDQIGRITTCPLSLAQHGVNLCPLHKRMDAALESFEQAFSQTTIAEMLAEPNPSVPLCEFPKAVCQKPKRAQLPRRGRSAKAKVPKGKVARSSRTKTKTKAKKKKR
jgi:Rrf2 family transcriptional regulator, nitric oxide-sensitive transcriptional repressor